MTIETRIARCLIRHALESDYTISVCDGEEWTLKLSTDADAIMKALQSTDSDVLRFRSKQKLKPKIGDVWLIWGNLEDVISDFSDNKSMSTLIDAVMKDCRL